LRIAVVNSIRVCGGGEKWLVRQASCWKANGHEPLIFCQPGSGLERIAREAGLSTQAVSMRNDVSLRAVARLATAMRRFRPDLVFCCNERAFRLAVPARKWAGKPPVIYRNGLTATFKNRSLNRLLFRDAARMIVISDPLREEMASYGWIPNERLQVIRNGIDTAGYQTDPAARQRVRAEVGTAPDAVVAAVLARVTEDKGQVETIEALASLASDYPKAELWIVGEGSLRPRLEDQARELGVTDRVKFLGFRTDIAAVFQAVDIVVQASHREGLGNTLLEAMASRKPILASSVGGIVDVVVPGETGELVPPYDSAAIAKALGPLLADPELRERYGEAGWRRVQEQFRLERETADWCRLFEELGGAAGARSSRDNRHDLAAV
jgi:glycosyltransferase involved in cell wall biosynthesis